MSRMLRQYCSVWVCFIKSRPIITCYTLSYKKHSKEHKWDLEENDQHKNKTLSGHSRDPNVESGYITKGCDQCRKNNAKLKISNYIRMNYKGSALLLYIHKGCDRAFYINIIKHISQRRYFIYSAVKRRLFAVCKCLHMLPQNMHLYMHVRLFLSILILCIYKYGTGTQNKIIYLNCKNKYLHCNKYYVNILCKYTM